MPYVGSHVRPPVGPDDEPPVAPKPLPRRPYVGHVLRAVAIAVAVAAALAGSGITQGPASAVAVNLPSGNAPVGTLIAPAGPTLGAKGLPSGTVGPKLKATPRKTKLTKPPAPEVVGTPIIVPPVTLPPSAGPTPSGPPAPLTLQDYLALMPSFPAPPAAQKISLTHVDGQAAHAANIPTTAPVAFLTIDDGWYKDPITAGLIKQSGLPFTAFLTIDAISDNVGFFQDLQSNGMVIEDHTISHPDLATLTYDEQVSEICPAADQLGSLFGRRPLYFRAPYISYNTDTLTAAWSCGIQAEFSGELSFSDGVMGWGSNRPDQKLQPGDIVILHFDRDFANSFITALNYIKAAGLTPALLEDWVTVN
jgi:peptidoglycan/xylan/chitin deacetylase (PgdA/CDA1 family)